MDLQLKGKRALVTGSSSGIGAEIARILAAEGASVVVHGRSVERAEKVAAGIRAAGGQAAVACGDLSNTDEANAVADKALEAFGGIDILVNNAGGAAHGGNPSWFTTGIELWTETFESNVLAAVRLIHKLVPPMKERGWGRVINIGTAAAITPTSAQPDYGAAKAAMLNFTLGLSKALSRSGVTVNAVSPGLVRTEGIAVFLSEFAAKRGWGDDTVRAENYIAERGGQTAKRIGEVQDIGNMVAMVASPLSDFVSGTNIHVDGGISPSIV